MVTKVEVLSFIANQTRTEKPICFEDLMDQSGLSYGAALNHLRRLLRERLIEIAGNRPEENKFQPLPFEKLTWFEFFLTDRGRERLQWYRLNPYWKKAYQ